MNLRQLSASLILCVLLVTPFINWRLGAVIWMCAWIMYVVQITLINRQRRVDRLDNDNPDR